MRIDECKRLCYEQPYDLRQVYNNNPGIWTTLRSGQTATFYGSVPMTVFVELDNTKNERVDFNASYLNQGKSNVLNYNYILTNS